MTSLVYSSTQLHNTLQHSARLYATLYNTQSLQNNFTKHLTSLFTNTIQTSQNSTQLTTHSTKLYKDITFFKKKKQQKHTQLYTSLHNFTRLLQNSARSFTQLSQHYTHVYTSVHNFTHCLVNFSTTCTTPLQNPYQTLQYLKFHKSLPVLYTTSKQ